MFNKYIKYYIILLRVVLYVTFENLYGALKISLDFLRVVTVAEMGFILKYIMNRLGEPAMSRV